VIFLFLILQEVKVWATFVVVLLALNNYSNPKEMLEDWMAGDKISWYRL